MVLFPFRYIENNFNATTNFWKTELLKHDISLISSCSTVGTLTASWKALYQTKIESNIYK